VRRSSKDLPKGGVTQRQKNAKKEKLTRPCKKTMPRYKEGPFAEKKRLGKGELGGGSEGALRNYVCAESKEQQTARRNLQDSAPGSYPRGDVDRKLHGGNQPAPPKQKSYTGQ